MHTTRRFVPVDVSPPYSPDLTYSDPWPRRDHLELGALPTAPGSARGHVGNVLREWHLSPFTEVTEMIVSDLMTNSVAATLAIGWPQSAPPVRLWLLANSVSVLVAVWDAVLGLPRPRQAGQGEESGRGLAIVGALSAEWNSYLCAAPYGGKATWARIGHP
jgi:hypothetical protein